MKGLKKTFVRKSENLFEYLNLCPQKYGRENRDKIIYYICEDNANMGFFAMYRSWLEYLYFSDICGYVPAIYAGRHFAYKEENHALGTRNPFEYYFVQPAGLGLHEVKNSYKVVTSNLLHREIVELVYTGKYGEYWYTQDYLRTMGNIVNKYVRFNEVTWKYICNGLEKLNIQNNKVLGAHIRGTDFKRGFNVHPVYLTAEDCFSAIDGILEVKKYDKIFVATDDKRLLNQFLEKYGSKMCCYKDVFRNDKDKSVVFEKSTRKNHKYRLGLEVLRDMYTLAVCDGLVAGISQVAVCAQINKIATGTMYEDLKIINKGINRNFKVFRNR